MKVTLRKRKKSGKISLYLDIYEKGKRTYEYLGLYLVPNPKTPLERKSNKENTEMAENIRAKRQLQYQNEQFGFSDSVKANGSFLTYFNKQKEKRISSINNYNVWDTTRKHMENWGRADIPINRIDIEWLEDIRHYLIHRARTKANKKLATNTCSSYYNKILAALNQAEKEGILNRNPARMVEHIKEEETQREFLTLEELQKAAITECENDVLKRAFLFSALTGLRFSDIKKLKWNEIQHSKDNGYYIRFEQQKTKGKETLPISEDAYKILGTSLDQNSPVFLDLEYSHPNNQLLREWIKQAGIDKYITFHCARHTYATLQLTFGTDLYTVSKLLGHKSISTTQRYAKIVDQKKIEAANRIKINL